MKKNENSSTDKRKTIMTLIVYNRENSRPQEVIYKGKRTINLDSRGTVYLSKTMSIELGILGGGRVNFAHDDETSPNIELLAVRRYSLVPICIQNSPHQTSGYMLFLSECRQTAHFRCHFQELRIRTV